MKKLLILIFISLLTFSNSYGAWFTSDENKMTLFGIGLGEHQDSLLSAPCYDFKNIPNVKKLDSMKFVDERDWKTLIYTDSKIPVAHGCVLPKIDNDDFFNFSIWVYPKTKEIYKIKATYKKTFLYSDRDLLPSYYVNPSNEEIRKLSIGEWEISNTECGQLAKSLRGIVISSHNEKGFEWKGSGVMMKKGILNTPIYKFEIESGCFINGNRFSGIPLITFGKKDTKEKKYNPDLKNTYFVTISISNQDVSRVRVEEGEIKDEFAKKNLNKKGL